MSGSHVWLQISQKCDNTDPVKFCRDASVGVTSVVCTECRISKLVPVGIELEGIDYMPTFLQEYFSSLAWDFFIVWSRKKN